MKKRWIVRSPDIELQAILGRELKISPLTAQLLINRGIVHADKAFSFLSPSLKNLHDPFTMKDMAKAVARIETAIRKQEKIIIYGDYDVDGTTATALLYLFLKEVNACVNYYIPERLKEGYGLNNQALKYLAESGAKLVITTDCGITNHEEITFANSIGLDVIITDHHEPPAEAGRLPSAYAILNPKQHDCLFPFKELAGVGVAFNLLIALRAKLKECSHFTEGAPNLKNYTDIVALGTIADMVPLVDENRILVKYGLDELTSGKRPGIRALKEVSRLGTNLKSVPIKTSSVGFQLAPRINAAGRLDKASMGVRLLITNDDKEAMDIARELDRENIDRQRLEKDILSEAIEIIESKEFEIHRKKAVVLAKDGWHSGVIGIVASRLVDRYHRPTVIISLKDGIGKGSARGINKFHILDALKGCEDLLEKYGGHKMAAGLTISEKNIQPFESVFYNLAEKGLNFEDLAPEVTLDSYIALAELNEKIIAEMELLAPFGLANPEPLLAARDTNIVQSEVVGNNHLKLKIRQGNGEAEKRRNGENRSPIRPFTDSPIPVVWDGIAYGMGGKYPLSGNCFDIAFIPYIDEWNGNRSLKLKVKEIKAG